jgi:hypothetical protein
LNILAGAFSGVVEFGARICAPDPLRRSAPPKSAHSHGGSRQLWLEGLGADRRGA